MKENKLESNYKEDRKELYEFYLKICAGTGFIIVFLSSEFAQRFALLMIIGFPIAFLILSMHINLYENYIFSKNEYFKVYPEKKRINKKYDFYDGVLKTSIYVLFVTYFTLILIYMVLGILKDTDDIKFNKIKQQTNIELLTKYSKKYDSLENLTSEQLEDLNKLVFSIVQLRTEEIPTKE